MSRIKAAINTILQQGLSRKSLALTLAMGTTVGVIPTVWGATLACALIATAMGLNQITIQMANYLAYPLQILLFVPFLQLGQQLFGPSTVSITRDGLVAGLYRAPFATLQSFGGANFKAIGAWALLSPLMTLFLYLLFAEILRLSSSNTNKGTHE